MIIFEGVLRRFGYGHSSAGQGSPGRAPRLQLKPRGDGDGYIDGTWWPRSSDLVEELPGLLIALGSRVGPARRVVYDRISWSRTPNRLVVGNRVVELDAHRFELGNTLYVFGSSGGMVVLRVITSATDRNLARAALLDSGV